MSKCVRIYPPAPRSGHTVEIYSLRGVATFRADRGWYSVSDDVAGRLARVLNNPNAPPGASPPVFQVVDEGEAVALEAVEEQRRAAASAPIDLTSRALSAPPPAPRPHGEVKALGPTVAPAQAEPTTKDLESEFDRVFGGVHDLAPPTPGADLTSAEARVGSTAPPATPPVPPPAPSSPPEAPARTPTGPRASKKTKTSAKA